MAYTQQDFLDAIYTTLTTAIPGVQVFNTAISPNAPVPYIVYSIVGDVPAIYFGTATDDFRVLLQVVVYDKREGTGKLTGGMRELRDVGEQVKAALHKKVLTVANAGNVSGWCTRRGDVRNENDNFNSVRQEFVFVGSETT